MSISQRLYLLFEIIRVDKLKFNSSEYENIRDFDKLKFNSSEYENIRDFESSDYDEPSLYAFRNFIITKNFNNNKIFILNVINMTNIHALRYFKKILTINLKNNDDKQFVREIIKINPIGLHNLPLQVIQDFDIANDIAEHYGGILEFLLHDDFRCNPLFVEKCYRNHISSLMYANEILLDNAEFMLAASVFDLGALRYLSNKLTNDIIFFDKLIKLKPDKVDIILYSCSDIVLNEYKTLIDYDSIKFMKMFGGKYSIHENVPINFKTKNNFRKYIKSKNFKYNHYLDSRNKEDFLEYSYY